MSTIYVTDLGLMAYDSAWRLQRALVDKRQSGAQASDHLLLLEHPPVITVGRRGDERHILVGVERLARMGVPVYRVERGGDVTYHGPGQLVAYPILDLRRFGRDVRGYVRRLLATIVAALATFGVTAQARQGSATGVWVVDDGAPPPSAKAAKIAAVGVRVERWISYHGLALNVSPDLSAFGLIVPCGLPDSPVTSMSAVLGRPVSVDEVKPAVVAAFGQEFDASMVALPVTDLEAEVA